MEQLTHTPQERVDEVVRRYHVLYDCVDRVVCAISGGKDSTAIMECGAIAAKERGRKLEVWFFDQELVPQPTLDYLTRTSKRDDLDFKWFCLPVQELNGFSTEESFWYPWDPEKKDEWTRPLPENAITDPPLGFIRKDLRLATFSMSRAAWPLVTAQVIGRRAAESPARRQIFNNTGWKTDTISRRYPCITASPIHDWSNDEVWHIVDSMGWDWNRIYLKMYQTGLPRDQLRVGPLFGEESSVTAHYIRKYAPEAWAAAEKRLPGIVALGRYALTPVMGRGRAVATSSPSSKAIIEAIESLPNRRKKGALEGLWKLRATAYRFRMPHAISVSDMLRVAARGDSKGNRRASGIVLQKVVVKKSLEGKYRHTHAVKDLAIYRKDSGTDVVMPPKPQPDPPPEPKRSVPLRTGRLHLKQKIQAYRRARHEASDRHGALG